MSHINPNSEQATTLVAQKHMCLLKVQKVTASVTTYLDGCKGSASGLKQIGNLLPAAD